MLSVAEALARITAAFEALPAETVGLTEALGRGSAHGVAAQSMAGVWEIVRIESEFADSVNTDPQPNLMLFTDNHYSFVWSFGDSTMTGYKERWVPTDSEKIQRYGEIIVNTGTYSVDGEKLTVYPIVAKNPEFIGGYMIFSINWVGDRLVLTPLDEYSFDGVQTAWVSESSGTTHLTLARISR